MKNKRVILLLTLFLVGLFFTPISTNNGSDSTVLAPMEKNATVSSSPVDREIRVALYNETDGTHPSYAGEGMNSVNATPIYEMLVNAGFQVDWLNYAEIQELRLNAIDYDVFVMFDHNPRDNITDLVMDFWLSGGSLLSIDSAIQFLNYMGIMAPETEGDNARNTAWNYVHAYSHNVSTRHPVTQTYAINESVMDLNPSFDYATFNRTYLEGSAHASDFVYLTSPDADPDWVSAMAKDPSVQGGKVVHMMGDYGREDLLPVDLIMDAVDWLAPRPKGRILFDNTHRPYYVIDQGDPGDFTAIGRYAPIRDELVTNRFIVDKLFDEEAPQNITADVLEPYDMLIITAPDFNYTAAEIAAIMSWVADGGGLLLLGERQTSTFIPDNGRINDVLAGTGLSMSSVDYLDWDMMSSYIQIDMHPITEDVTNLHFAGGSYVNVTGEAYPLVTNGSNVIVGARDWGEGRIILAGDINFFDDDHDVYDNFQFSINIVNWLTSGNAEILLYSDGDTDNWYRSAVAEALNELGADYMLTFDRDYFNLSLNMYDWDLVISDSNNYAPITAHSRLIEHLEGGGKLIMRDFMFRNPGFALWHYMGFDGNGTSITIAPPDVYIWESEHPLFNMPVDYGSSTVTTVSNYQNTDYTHTTLFDNATALAGISPTPEQNMSAIVLGAEGRALCNMFAIYEYDGDTDDSTYADNYELWLNEISFMLRPAIDSPGDVLYEFGSTGNEVTWTPDSWKPAEFIVEKDGAFYEEGVWDGLPITVPIDEFEVGTFEIEITVFDSVGYFASDVVEVVVEDTTAPTWILAPVDQELELGEALQYQLEATDPSGLGNWSVSHPDFDITAGGVLENNTALEVGVYELLIIVEDIYGNSMGANITVTVSEPPTPSTTTMPTTATTTTTPPPGGDYTTLIIIIVAAGGVVIIIIVILMKKRS